MEEDVAHLEPYNGEQISIVVLLTPKLETHPHRHMLIPNMMHNQWKVCNVIIDSGREWGELVSQKAC